MRAPASIWKAYRRGRYRRVGIFSLASLVRGRKVRFGAYGDPAMVPIHYWQLMASSARAHTGYTHQELEPWFPSALASMVMISADSAADAITARAEGRRSFRVTTPDEAPLPFEILCPASEEAGRRTTCEDCALCSGDSIAKSIYIPAHGAGNRLAQRRLSNPWWAN